MVLEYKGWTSCSEQRVGALWNGASFPQGHYAAQSIGSHLLSLTEAETEWSSMRRSQIA